MTKVIEQWWDDDMTLPKNKTCKDCRYFIKCEAFGWASVNHIWCDFSPSRFAEIPDILKDFVK